MAPLPGKAKGAGRGRHQQQRSEAYCYGRFAWASASSQRIHDLVPDASPPPTNEAIVTWYGGHRSLAGRATAHLNAKPKRCR